MARGKNLLTDTQIKRFSIPENKPRHKISDGDSLYISVESSGTKRWIYVYNKPNGKRTDKVIGKYPQMSLKEARETRDRLKYSIVPTSMTFGDLKDAYFNFKKGEWTEGYLNDNERYFKNDFKHLIDIPLSDITKKDLIAGFTMMKSRGVTDGIRKASNAIRSVFVYGVTMGLIDDNPMSNINPSFFIEKKEVKQYAHITDENVLKTLLCAIKSYEGITYNVRAAMMFAVYAFVRPGSIQFMEKAEIDFKKKLWTIPAEKMKGQTGKRRAHIVPLTDSMIDILKSVWDINDSKYVFPSPQSNTKTMSENTLNNSLKRLGVCEITAHGLRHTASTFLNENIANHGQRSEIIEVQLAHTDKNIIRGVYNKAVYMKERKALMQWWSNYLDHLQENCE